MTRVLGAALSGRVGRGCLAHQCGVWIAVAVWVIAAPAAQGWVFPPEPVQVVHWDEEQGLPPGSLSAALQTSDGFLWLGGDEGLTRLGGVTAVQYDSRNVPEFRNHRVVVLFGDSEGRLWVASRGGLQHIRNGRVESFGAREDLGINDVVGVACGLGATPRAWIS